MSHLIENADDDPTHYYEIPLIVGQPQTLTIELTDGLVYGLRLTWCAPVSVWTLDVYNESGVALAEGLAVITGANLLEQLAYLGIGGQITGIFAHTSARSFDPPSYVNLGDNGKLYFWSPP